MSHCRKSHVTALIITLAFSYEVLQYPLTDFVVEEDETQQEEDQDEEARDDVVEMREMKDGESDVTSRTLSTRKQSVISNLSGIV